ncbi:MAG TPA: nucleotide exchange factor GrpE [Steroidobacteraceae bacterium]
MTVPNDERERALDPRAAASETPEAEGGEGQKGQNGRNGQEGQQEEERRTSELEALQKALAEAEARAAEHKDLYLRALAEVENIRKRAARDLEQAHKFAVERFATDLIAVKDSLEMGLVSSGSIESLREGTEATLKLLSKAFENAGLTEIDPRGEPFNPQLHEAMAVQPSTEHAPNTVVQIIQKGYQLNGRVVRPARVIVSKES